jgi:hypothetical protein
MNNNATPIPTIAPSTLAIKTINEKIIVHILFYKLKEWTIYMKFAFMRRYFSGQTVGIESF